jgi:Tetratricopeptide repeat
MRASASGSAPPRRGPRACGWRHIALLVLVALLPLGAEAYERLLDRIDVDGAHIAIQFNCQMAYVSHFPLRSGAELRIELQPLPGCGAGSGYSETLPFASPGATALSDVRLELGIGARRALILRFSRNVDYLVRPMAGLTGIEILLAARSGSAKPELVESVPSASRTASRALPPAAELDRLSSLALEAMRSHDYDLAIRLYTKLLEYPEHPGRAKAQEYLGLARERKGQFAQAKQEYQEYLRRYPDGIDATEVSQRLAALVTLEGQSNLKRGDPDQRWQYQAGISQEYRHDRNTVSEAGVDSPGIGQSVLYSDADLVVRRRAAAYDFSARADAGYLKDFQNSGLPTSGSTRVAALYAELGDAGHKLLARAGRQSATTGGVYGTFDGLYAGWRVSPAVRLDLSIGRPLQVYSTQTTGSRTFISSAAEFLGLRPGLDLGLFVLEQKAGGLLDQREVGSEVRYYHRGQSLVAQFNYDISFRVLNAVTALGTFNLADRWVATGVIDHRKAPFIATYNALIGQPTTSLDSLIARIGLDATRQLAIDRSANSDSYNLGIQRPLGERLQWWNNLSYSRLGATPASGGVPEVPSIGGLVNVSTQLLGNGWLTDSDTNVIGLVFGKGAGTRNISVFGSARYSLTDHLRFGPRLTINDTRTTADASTGLVNGVTVTPALLLDYQVRHGSIQLETGYERINQTLLNGALPGSPGAGTSGAGGGSTGTEVSAGSRRYWFGAGYHLSF